MARQHVLWLGNTVNRVMISSPVPAHSLGLAAVAQRKLWLMQPGDAAFLPQPVDPAFAAYVASITGCAGRWMAPAGSPLVPLGEPTRDTAPELVEYLRAVTPIVNAYALDASAVEFCGRNGLTIAGYDTVPQAALLRTISRLNSKSGFRALARELDLPAPPGRAVSGAGELARAIEETLVDHSRALVKLDRSSNGFGHWVVERSAAGAIATRARDYLRTHAPQGPDCVVEACMPFTMVPSVEAVVTDDAVAITYCCDQRYDGLSFAGMVSPPGHLSPLLRRQLEDAARHIGALLLRRGYRGYFDVDAGVSRDGELMLTECNVRRTAGTWIHELLQRLLGVEAAATRAWIADSCSPAAALTLPNILALLRDVQAAWDPAAGRGVLIPAFTLSMDNRCRYLAVGRDREEAEALEAQLRRALGAARTTALSA